MDPIFHGFSKGRPAQCPTLSLYFLRVANFTLVHQNRASVELTHSGLAPDLAVQKYAVLFYKTSLSSSLWDESDELGHASSVTANIIFILRKDNTYTRTGDRPAPRVTNILYYVRHSRVIASYTHSRLLRTRPLSRRTLTHTHLRLQTLRPSVSLSLCPTRRLTLIVSYDQSQGAARPGWTFAVAWPLLGLTALHAVMSLD